MRRFEVIEREPSNTGGMFDAPNEAHRGGGHPPNPIMVEAERYEIISNPGTFIVTFFNGEDEPVLTLFHIPRMIRLYVAPNETA